MSIYLEIAGRIRSEILQLDVIVKKASVSWQLAAKHSEYTDICLDSVALNLHSFYSGLERIFELIAGHVDNKFPEGQTWHRDLIIQMASDIEEVRPAVRHLPINNRPQRTQSEARSSAKFSAFLCGKLCVLCGECR